MPYWATVISGPQLCPGIGSNGYTGIPVDLDLLASIAFPPPKSLTARSKRPIVRTDHGNADHLSKQDLSPLASRPVRGFANSTTAPAAHPSQGDEARSAVDGQIPRRGITTGFPSNDCTNWLNVITSSVQPGGLHSRVLCTRASSAQVGMGQAFGNTAMVGANDGRERKAPVKCIADRRLLDNLWSLDRSHDLVETLVP
ncbi:hypothetical protein ASPBRDRAFT_71511 [Aspergillus brasiliensis CBS 101740]|uniref:Uncharacterized protein n=1 Tax=Aspergillus brasiliensis (strain CBS 101740 / IMI 381727 / IBT 21946) TaxID=767769 RepID=A0A1L9V340_ASPBC|nr:hypothetical protein ASPBRDRAFT_71511 [Aspergillus brasiliensis CBS 101740]